MTENTTDIRVALVTGASGGIGRAVAQQLAAAGYAVAVHYAGNKTAADTLVAEINEAAHTTESDTPRAIAVGGDVADEVAMASAFDAVEAAFGAIDVVVNTAGVMRLGPIADYSLDDFDQTVRTNLRGTFVVSQLAAQRVRAEGAIINFSTSVTRTQFPGYGAYVATKAGVEALTLILARELRGRSIRVNTVAPGPTATPLFLNGKDEATIAGLAKAAPLERLGTPDDIARVVVDIAARDSWINGQTVFANGGLA